MPKSPSQSLFVKVLFGAAVAVCAAIGACATVEGQTPDCKANVGGAGIIGTSSGCEQFATCAKGDPKNCCVDDKGDPLTGADLASCLWGYGVASTTTTSSATGGAGGGPADAGSD